MKQALIAMFVFSLICCASAQAGASEAKAPDKPMELKNAKSQKMWVTFKHATHKSIQCDVCHHLEPTDAASPYVSCGAGEECHYIKGGKSRDVQSMFWAFHAKDAERSCYGCHRSLKDRHPDFKGCRPCHMSPQAAKAAAKTGR